MTTNDRQTSVKQGEGVSPDAYATDMLELTVFFSDDHRADYPDVAGIWKIDGFTDGVDDIDRR